MSPLTYDPSSIFGRVITGDDVEEWCGNLIERWFSTYLSEVERQHGLPQTYWQRPRTVRRSLSYDKWPEDQVPGIMVVSTGVPNAPLRDGHGMFRARWLMGLGVLTSARTEEETHVMARHYLGALELLFIQRPSLDGMADGGRWLSLDYSSQLVFDDSRTLCSGIALFEVEVYDAANAFAGPLRPDEPSDDPWAPWPIVLTHEEVVLNTPPPDPLPEEEQP